MFLQRNPWIVVAGSVVTASCLYFLAVGVRQLDAKTLLGNWFLFAAIFVIFAAIAIVAYRSLPRAKVSERRDQQHA